jgi:S-adenosylmethionine-diacylglycerol 3-amino-3-carboxypropyl transferase
MSTEISQRADFSQLRYAQCWEDADLLVRAIMPTNRHRLLSIGSAGDNVLALLAQGPERLVAIDLSPVQIASLELRVAAYRTLDYPDVMHLLGVDASAFSPNQAQPNSMQSSSSQRDETRLDLYNRCRPLLSPYSQHYWDAHDKDIAAGMIAQGRFERYLRVFSNYILPLIHSAQTRNSLLQRRNLIERCQFYTTVWNTWRWRSLFRIFFSRALLGRGRDPAFFRYVEGNVAIRLLHRSRDALTMLDPTRNPYLQWILLGRHGSALPFALRPQNFQSIRQHLDRLEWHTTTLEGYLATTRSSHFNGFNLSNIFEYMSVPSYYTLLDEIVRTARPDARLVYWNLFAPRRRPDELAKRLLSLDNLAATLHRQDQAFFYSALVIEQAV